MLVASTTGLITTAGATLFGGVYSVLSITLPYAVGMLLFYAAFAWTRRALGGR